MPKLGVCSTCYRDGIPVHTDMSSSQMSDDILDFAIGDGQIEPNCIALAQTYILAEHNNSAGQYCEGTGANPEAVYDS